MADIVSAIFSNNQDAQDAVDWLRSNGVSNDAISVIARNANELYDTSDNDLDDDDEAADDAADAGKGALTGVGVGAAVGALFGLAAAAIPGVGPFITAGALASALGPAAGGAAAGAIVGGTSGGLAGALSHWGLNEAESKYYAGEVERGGTYVAVDLVRTSVNRSAITDALRRYHGRFAS